MQKVRALIAPTLLVAYACLSSAGTCFSAGAFEAPKKLVVAIDPARGGDDVGSRSQSDSLATRSCRFSTPC